MRFWNIALFASFPEKAPATLPFPGPNVLQDFGVRQSKFSVFASVGTLWYIPERDVFEETKSGEIGDRTRPEHPGPEGLPPDD
jgi:hypothetical protein